MMRRAIAVFCLLAAVTPLVAQQTERDRWQRPAEVMDALEIAAGSRVADVGAGGGYFTFHLAARVGPAGKVYAEDILEDVVEKIRKRAARERLAQIQAIFGTEESPRLPEGELDAILVVNAYHEMQRSEAMMRAFSRALKPGGRLGILDVDTETGKPREQYHSAHRIPKKLVIEDAARQGLRLVSEKPGFANPDNGRVYYFLIFVRSD
jgi:predicted methyltransferase